MAMPEPRNGDYVTWRELNLALDPLKADVREVRDVVNVLHADFFTDVGSARERRNVQSARHFWIGVVVAIFAATLTALITIVAAQ